MPKYKIKQYLSFPLAMLVGFGGVFAYADYNVYDYVQENQLFLQEKINTDLEYYGGDERYIAVSKDLLNREIAVYNHFNIEKNRPVKIGFDAALTDNEKEQFTYTIEYINSVFQTINPEYSFEIVNEPSYKCDIYIDKQPANSQIGAWVNLKRDPFNASRVTGGKIHFNTNTESSNTQLRFFLAHEFMHIFFGSPDIDYTKSKTFSLYNYDDIGGINYVIENAYATQEEADNSFGMHKPVMTAEEKNSFITFTPTDISTLIAIYGDSSTAENREAYINLINETLDTCSKVFGDFQHFYEEGFTVPTAQTNTTHTNEDLTF